MKIKVKFLGMHRELSGVEEDEIEIEANQEINDVWDEVKHRYPKLESLDKSTMISLDKKLVDFKTGLKDGDEIVLFLPVAGG